MKRTRMLVMTAAIVLGFGTVAEAKLPKDSIVVGSNVYDVSYLASNMAKINDEIMNNLGSIFYVDDNYVTKDIFTGSTVDDSQLVNRVGNTLNYYNANGQVQKLVADSTNTFDPNGTYVGNLSAVINVTYKKITVGTQTLYAYTVRANQVLGLQDAAYFSLDTSSTVPLTEVNTYIGTALTGTPKLVIYDTAQKDIASGTITGLSLSGDSGTIDKAVALHYDGTQNIQTGNGNSSVNISNTGFAAIDSDGKWIYYVNTGDGNKLYKKSVSGADDSPISDDKVGYINILGDWVYYINYNDGGKIYKVRTDGTQRQKVADDMASSLNILSGKIYYINHSDRARIYVIDSQGTRQLISDSANFLSAGDSNSLYYVNTLDSNKLYRYLLTNSTKSAVSNVPVQFLNVIGDSSVLYVGKDGLIYASSGSYNSSPSGMTAVTNVPLGKTSSSSLNAVNDKLTVICGEDADNVYYKSFADGGKLYKLDKKSGNGYKVVDDVVDYVNIVGDYLYYMKSGKLYYIPKDSDTVLKGTAVAKPKSTLKISKIDTLPTFSTDDITKFNFPDRVAAIMSDGTVQEVVVTWNKTIPKPSKGVYTFSGTVLGYGNKVSISVILDSGVIDTGNVSIVNGVGSKDTVTVSKLNQGDIINIYGAYADTKPLKTVTAGANGIATATGLNLNANGDSLYITITKIGKSEGQKTSCSYGPEAPVNFAVDAANGKITGLKSGLSYKVYLEIPDSNGNLPTTPASTALVATKTSTDGSIQVDALKTMTDLRQLRLIATNVTNSKDSSPSSSMEVGKPKLTSVSIDLTNARLIGTTVDMVYSYAYDSDTNQSPTDWTSCLAISTPVSMTRSLQVSVKSQAKGPYLDSDVATYGLFPAPVISGIKDGDSYYIGNNLTASWPAVDDSNGTITYKAVLYNLTKNTSNNTITTTANPYSSDLVKWITDPTTGKLSDSSSIIKSADIAAAGTNYKLVVTATKTITSGSSVISGKASTTVNFTVTSGKPQTVDIAMAEKPGTMKKDSSGNWVNVDSSKDALTYYQATPTWTDYAGTSSTAVIQRLDLNVVTRDLSKVDLATISGLNSSGNSLWNGAAKVSIAPSANPITQDGYYKLTVTSKADDNKSTMDTVKYFIVDSGRTVNLPKVTVGGTTTSISDNGQYSAGISSITIDDDTECLTKTTLIRDGYVTQLIDTSGAVINPTVPDTANTSGKITLNGTYQLDLSTTNVVNGRPAHKAYTFYVDNTASVSPDIQNAVVDNQSSGDDYVTVGDNSSEKIPYDSIINVYSASGSLLKSYDYKGTPGAVKVTIDGGIPSGDTYIYVTITEAGKLESNRVQVAVPQVTSIKSISQTSLTETPDNDGTVTVDGTTTGINYIDVEIQNGTVSSTPSVLASLPSGLTAAATKIDETHIRITITGNANANANSNSLTGSNGVIFTIPTSAITANSGVTAKAMTTDPITINFIDGPTVTDAQTTDTTHIKLTMSSALQGASGDINAFKVTSTVGTLVTNPTVKNVVVSGTTVTLELDSAAPIAKGQTLTVDYTATGTNDLTNGTIKVSDFTGQPVTNNIP